jgi:hypothetical protein
MIGKEEWKPSLFLDDMNLHVEILSNSLKSIRTNKSSVRFQKTVSVYKNQLYFHTFAMNKSNMKLDDSTYTGIKKE